MGLSERLPGDEFVERDRVQGAQALTLRFPRSTPGFAWRCSVPGPASSRQGFPSRLPAAAARVGANVLLDESVDSRFKSCLHRSLAVQSWGRQPCKRGAAVRTKTDLGQAKHPPPPSRTAPLSWGLGGPPADGMSVIWGTNTAPHHEHLVLTWFLTPPIAEKSRSFFIFSKHAP